MYEEFHLTFEEYLALKDLGFDGAGGFDRAEKLYPGFRNPGGDHLELFVNAVISDRISRVGRK